MRRLSLIAVAGHALRGKLLHLAVQRQTVGKLLRDGLPVQRQRRRYSGIPGACAYAHIVCPGLQNPDRPLLIIGGHGLHGIGNDKLLGLSRGQFFRLLIGSQLLVRLRQLPCRGGIVHLHHFLARVCTPAVGHLHLHGDSIPVRFHILCLHGEIRVGAAVAKGIRRGHVKGIKITVSHIDSLGIVFIIDVAVHMAELLGAGIIQIILRPCGGELAAGRHLARHHVRQGIAADIARLAHEQDGIDSLFPPEEFGVNDAAHI